MDNPEKLATYGTQAEEKNRAKNTTQYVLDTTMRKQTLYIYCRFISILLCVRVQIHIFTFAENVAHNLCCQWKCQSHSPAHLRIRL
jgi:hypothetical protein